MQKVNSKEYERQVLDLVNGATDPITIDFVSTRLKISWDTGRALLLGLACRGRIRALKTMKSWVFFCFTCGDCAHWSRTCLKTYDNRSKVPCPEFLFRGC